MLCGRATAFFERVAATTNEAEADTLFSQIPDNGKEAVDIVLEALIRSLPNTEVQISGLRKLNRIITANPQSRRTEVASKGGLEQVTMAMTVHSLQETVQTEGCAVLLWLVHENAPYQMLITERGGMEAVVTAMNNFPANTILQTQGCSIIGNAAVHDSNIKRIIICGGVEATISAMNRCRNNVQMQINGCVALGNIGENIKGAHYLLKKGGIEAIVGSLYANNNNDSAQTGAAFYALCTFTTSVYMRMRVFECGGISAIVAAMNAHRNNPGIQSSGCVTLGNICVSTECRSTVFIEGGVEAIVAAMSNFPDNVDVQYSGCVALGLVVRNSECRDAFVDNGGVSVLINAMQRFKDDHRIIGYGCYTFGAVAKSPIGRKIALARGGLDVVIGALDNFLGNPVITTDICVTTESLLAVEEEHRKYCTSRILETFIAAAHKSPHSIDLQEIVHSLRREEDPRVTQALNAGLCSSTFIPRCKADTCPLKQCHCYCTKCTSPQWTYLCLTCYRKTGVELRFCVTCWRHHSLGPNNEPHVAEKQFLHKRCSCEDLACKVTLHHLLPPPCKIPNTQNN